MSCYSFLTEDNILSYPWSIFKIYGRKAYHGRNALSYKLKKYLKKREELHNEEPPQEDIQYTNTESEIFYDPITQQYYTYKDGVAVPVEPPQS